MDGAQPPYLPPYQPVSLMTIRGRNAMTQLVNVAAAELPHGDSTDVICWSKLASTLVLGAPALSIPNASTLG